MNRRDDASLEVHRLFVAIRPPPAVSLELARLAQRWLAGPNLRLYPAEHLHITLVFLGGVIGGSLPDLSRALASQLRGLAAPRLSIGHTGAFPSPARPRVVWAGVEPDDDLSRVHSTSCRAVRSCGLFAAEVEAGAAWKPHITLARPARGQRILVPQGFLDLAPDLEWRASAVVLVESHPGQVGEKRYPIIASFPLARATGSGPGEATR